jgi:hypothetical protein
MPCMNDDFRTEIPSALRKGIGKILKFHRAVNPFDQTRVLHRRTPSVRPEMMGTATAV